MVLAGVYSASKLAIDAVPDITNNQVQIITTAPTLGAEEIEKLITAQVEYSIATLPGVVELRSVSRFGLSIITVVFEDDVEVFKARQMVGERLAQVADKIPAGLPMPEMMPPTTGLGEIYQYILRHKPGYEGKYSPMELRTIQDWIVKKRLLGVPGVAEISSIGGFVRQYEIAINPERLRSFGLTLTDILQALNTQNENTGGAYIESQSELIFIRGKGMVSSGEEIEKIVIQSSPEGIPILIGDVAEVKLGHAPRFGAMTLNGEGECVGGIVLMLKGAGSAHTIAAVKSRIEEINRLLPEGLYIEPFLDRTVLIHKAINTIIKNLAEGALIVVFILVLMLGNLRAGLLMASVIPLSMLFAISMMYLFGISGNLMSLGAIDFGIIVDGAVIIVEAILHRLEHNTGIEISQKQYNDLVYESASKIRSAAAFGEIIILIVYLPILTLKGVEGKMFVPMAMTVGFAVLGAFLLSLTYVPMMAALWIRPSRRPGFSHRITARLQRMYLPVLKFSLRNGKLVILVAVLAMVSALVLFWRFGGEFVPKLDEGDFALEVRLPTGASLSHTINTTLKISQILLDSFPAEVAKTIGKIGSSEIPTDPMPIEACDLMVILHDKSQWKTTHSKSELADRMKEVLEVHLPGVDFGFMQPIEMRFNELMTGAKQDVAITIYGDEMSELANLAEKVAAIATPIPGVVDVFVEKVSGLPEATVSYRREKIAQYGIKIADLNRTLRAAFAGEKAGIIFQGQKMFDIVVRLDTTFRRGLQDIRRLYISLPNGNQVPLEEVADVRLTTAPAQISRQNSQRKITVAFNVRGRDVESTVADLKTHLDKSLQLSEGYFYHIGGQFENLVQAKSRLAVALPIALGLIFALLYLTFGSFKLAGLIFISVPFAAVGGVWAMALRQMDFSISAGVGFIALFGVAVLNGIVLVGYFRELQRKGYKLSTRVVRGATTRLRPVVMTALVASLGFLPMAVSVSAGAEVQRPLATVVIGGLISSTILTLLVLPVLYLWLEKKSTGALGD